jgi:phenylacetate-CoA ligase
MTEAFTASFPGALDELYVAYEQVPFFGRHLDAAGLHPDDILTTEDFRRVPPTAKPDYRRNFPAGVLVRGATLNDPSIYKSRSSGTTGDRLLTVVHTFTLADRMTATTTVHPGLLRVFAAAKEQRLCRYAPPNCSDVECATPFTTPATRTLPDGTLVLPVAHDLLATPDVMVRQAIDELSEYGPHWLYVDPQHLAFLVRSLRRHGIPPPAVGGVVLTYNVVAAMSRRQIAEFFPPDTVTVEVASMSELGWMGMECPSGFLHLNTESFYLELLPEGDGPTRPAEPGELAELYVTSIGDEISPHIRYRTGDLYTLLDGDCPCGHRFPRAVHHGRRKDVMRAGDGTALLTPKQLDQLVGPARWLDVYKLHQLTPGRFRFRYIPAGDDRDDAAAGELTAELRAALGSGLTVEAADYIECERSGKFLPCVSEVPL